MRKGAEEKEDGKQDEGDRMRNLIFVILCIAVFDWRSLARNSRGRLSIRKSVLTSPDVPTEQLSFCRKFEGSDGCTDWLLNMHPRLLRSLCNLSYLLQLHNSWNERRKVAAPPENY